MFSALGGQWPPSGPPCEAGSLCGFSGSRHLPQHFAPLVFSVVTAAHALGLRVAVGDASGLDRLVRAADPAARVFKVGDYNFLLPRAALVRRSAALVLAVAESRPGAPQFCVFVDRPCPAGLVPSARYWDCFAGFGSGSWASAALAVGMGLPVSLFWCTPGPPVLPAWDGTWWPEGSLFTRATSAAVRVSLFQSASVQAGLFSVGE